MPRIYFDNSATTPVDERVLAAMLPYFREDFGNPGSIHSFGQKALTAVDEARGKVASYLNCQAQEVIFTAGATESSNMAIQGVVNNLLKQKKPIHIITTKIEHPSVLNVFKELAKREGVEVSFINVDGDGVVKIDELARAIKPNTILVSVMYANNEVGSIQPIAEISEIIKKARVIRAKGALPIYFHVDAVQAFNYLDCDVNKLGVDFLSFSGHKIYGPKGIGGLFIRAGVKIDPLIHGGHYEYGLRAGTLNVPGIVGLAEAVVLVGKEKLANIKKIQKIKSKLIRSLEKFEDFNFNGALETQLPNIINVSFYKAEGESILMMLDMDGIAISTGSACSSGSLEPSHVLIAMGIKPEWSHGSVRISLGKYNTEEEVVPFIKSLEKAVKRLRGMAP